MGVLKESGYDPRSYPPSPLFPMSQVTVVVLSTLDPSNLQRSLMSVTVVKRGTGLEKSNRRKGEGSEKDPELNRGFAVSR